MTTTYTIETRDRRTRQWAPVATTTSVPDALAVVRAFAWINRRARIIPSTTAPNTAPLTEGYDR